MINNSCKYHVQRRLTSSQNSKHFSYYSIINPQPVPSTTMLSYNHAQISTTFRSNPTFRSFSLNLLSLFLNGYEPTENLSTEKPPTDCFCFALLQNHGPIEAPPCVGDSFSGFCGMAHVVDWRRWFGELSISGCVQLR